MDLTLATSDDNLLGLGTIRTMKLEIEFETAALAVESTIYAKGFGRTVPLLCTTLLIA